MLHKLVCAVFYCSSFEVTCFGYARCMKSTRFCFCLRRSGNSYWILQWWPMGKYILNTNTIDPKTRMHSSRMRTGRSLAVYWGSVCFQGGYLLLGGYLPPGGGGLPLGGCLPLGKCLLLGDVCFQGVSAPGGGVCLSEMSASRRHVYPSMQWGRHPPPLWTESQTGVKT